MDLRKLIRLRQAQVEKPCPESWDAMEGDDKQRFCAGCGCYVHNIESLGADEAEELLGSSGRVCTRMKTHETKGILTLDGWVSRLAAAGVVAAAAAAIPAQDHTIGKLAIKRSEKPISKPPTKPVKNAPKPKPKDEVVMLLGHRAPLPAKPVKKGDAKPNATKPKGKPGPKRKK